MKTSAFLLTLCCLMGALPAHAGENVSLCSGLSTGSGLPDDKKYMGHVDAGPNGWLFVDSDFADQSPFEGSLINAFKRLQQALAARGSTLVFATIPSRPMVYPAEVGSTVASSRKFDSAKAIKSYTARLAQLEGAGIVAPDLYTPLAEAAAKEPVFFKYDHHLTPEGAVVATKAIAAAVMKLKPYASIPAKQFSVQASGSKDNAGSYEKLVREVCNTPLPKEQINLFVTHAVGGGNDLLGDDSAQMALIGTSMSNRGDEDQLNFVGNLQATLSREITNAAVEGGWVDASAISYFNTDAYRISPPKILIWEMPSKYLTAKYSRLAPLFRQIIPAAKGACPADKALLKQDSSVKGATPLLTVGKEISSTAERDFIFFEATDLSLVEFTLKLEYDGGKSESVKIERSTRLRNSGRYFMELGNDNLRAVTLTPEGYAKGSITARLCRG